MTRTEFTQQVIQTQEGLRRFLLALCCGDAALADDIAQDAYVKAYLACGSLDDNTKFGAWMRRIAYNTFVSSRRATRINEPLDAAVHITADGQPDSPFRYQALYSALSHLPASERTAVALFYFDGYSIKEIAHITSGSEAAVKQLLWRARTHLKKLLS